MEKLSDKAKAIYDLLRSRPTVTDENGIYCTYPIKELSNNSNISVMSVRRSLKELEEKNYIFCQKQGGNKEQKIYLNTPFLENEHSIPENEHSIPENEHSISENEHSISENEHSISENEHSIPENEHSIPESVHSNFDLSTEYATDAPSDEFLDYFAAEQGLFTIDEVAEQVPEKEKREKKPPFTIEILENYLQQHGISIRENIITHEMEVQGLPEEYNFEGNSGHLGGILYSELKKAEIPSSMNAITAYLPIIAKKNGYNPVAEMLKGKIWDGKDRLTELYDIMHITDAFQQLLIRKWLMQAISVTLYNNDKEPFAAEGTLTLVGGQAIGKTTLARKLGISSKICKTGISVDPRNKDTIITAISCFIAELGELESTFKADISALKAFLTLDYDTVRVPYGRSYEKITRRTTFIATVNSRDFLIDESGNRRFWCVDCPKRFELAKLQEFDEIQLWLQVHEIVKKQGLQAFRLTADELQTLNTRNTTFEKPLKSQVEVEDILSMTGDEYYRIEYKLMTITEFKCEWQQELRAYSAVVIGKALDRLGIETQLVRTDNQVKRVRNLPKKIYPCDEGRI